MVNIVKDISTGKYVMARQHFCSNWITGKNLKEDFKIPLWSINNCKKIHKNREEFQEWGGGNFSGWPEVRGQYNMIHTLTIKLKCFCYIKCNLGFNGLDLTQVVMYVLRRDNCLSAIPSWWSGRRCRWNKRPPWPSSWLRTAARWKILDSRSRPLFFQK